MLSNKLSAALEALGNGEVDPSHSGEFELNVTELPLDELSEVLSDPSIDEVAGEHLAALQSAIESLVALSQASSYIDGGMSRERYVAVKRVAGHVPALEAYFSENTEAMFTVATTEVGHSVSNENIIEAISKGAEWVVKKIRELLSWIADAFRKYIWAPTVAEDKAIVIIQDMVPVVNAQNNLLETPIAHGTMVRNKVAEVDVAYLGKINSYWSKLSEVHMTTRNLDVLSSGLYRSIITTLGTFNETIIKVSNSDASEVAKVVSKLYATPVRFEVREFIHAVTSRDMAVPDSIIKAVALLEEVTVQAAQTRLEFNGELTKYHDTLTSRTEGFKSLTTDMSFAHKTFTSLVEAQLARTDITPETINMLSEMTSTIMTLINVARRTRGLHTRMLSDASVYLTKRAEVAARAVKAPGTPQELQNAIAAIKR